MNKSIINYRTFEKWLTNNINSVECVDCIEGCLLDSLLYCDNNGLYTAFIETFETSNSSCYTMLSGSIDEVSKEWDKLKRE